MWAITCSYADWSHLPAHPANGGAATSRGQLPPGNFHAMGWWPEAYAGWYQQAQASAAQSSTTTGQVISSSESSPSISKKALPKSLRRMVNSTAASTPPGLSFFELEQRLSRSWEELHPPSSESASPHQTSTEQLLADLMEATPSSTSNVSIASLFCPLCADRGGACPFHAGSGWASDCSMTRERRCAQHTACEAPPPSHIAHSMVDKVLDMNEDASTEAGSIESVEGLSSYGSASRSDELSDEGSVLEGGIAAELSSNVPLPCRRWGATRLDVQPSSKASTESLRQLISMGFSEAAARSALDQTSHRGVDAAVTFLIDGITA